MIWRKRSRVHLFLFFSFLTALTLQSAQPAHPQEDRQPSESNGTQPIRGIAGALLTESPPYRIGVEDVLLISVWREPDLTREVPVRPDGKISLPLIQDVHAAGKTPGQLAKEIDSRLRQFLSSPSVTVVVREVNSRKVFLLGEVAQPGPVVIRSKTRLLQAISMAGGVTPFGGRNGIVIYRKTLSGEEVFNISYKEIVAGRTPEDNVVLEPGDTIVVQ